jgi:hypothetical protein
MEGPGTREAISGFEERTMDKVILILILPEPPILGSFCPICPLRLDAKVSDLYGFPPPETWPSAEGGGLLNRYTAGSSI